MSKKTKKEKIISDLRKKLEVTTQNVSENIIGNDLKKNEFKFNSKITSSSIHQNSTPTQTTSLYVYPVQLIKKDLTKTLVLCILAISLEIALYLILEKHLALPFNLNF